jgi:hypothetical protein
MERELLRFKRATQLEQAYNDADAVVATSDAYGYPLIQSTNDDS